MIEEPDPPEEAPNYVVDGLDRQDPDVLRALADYARERADWLERDLQPDEVDVGDDEELVDVNQDPEEKGTEVEKKIPCGKDCNGCPHGPYKYRVWREGDKVRTKYLGPVS